jgi:hypothetical protein
VNECALVMFRNSFFKGKSAVGGIFLCFYHEMYFPCFQSCDKCF